MDWADRLAYQLIKPRNPRWAQVLLRGVTIFMTIWAFAVCILITAAFVMTLIGEYS